MRCCAPRAWGSASIAAALLLGGPSCTDQAYACNADDQCVSGDALGVCEPSGFCSFPDGTCDSGRRYGAHAGELAHACVPTDVEESSGPGTTLGATSLASTVADEATDSDPGETVGDDTGTTTTTGVDPTVASETSETSDPSETRGETSLGSTDDTATTGGGCEPFTDDFERPDAVAIGNDWIEKHPLTFAIAGGRMVFESEGVGFENGLVYRPAAEEVLDVEVSVEVRFDVASPPNHPQVHLRSDAAVIGELDTVHAYVIFIEDDNGSALAIARVDADGVWGAYDEVLLPEPLEVAVDYRMRASTIGTDPVVIDAAWERLEGEEWVVVTTLQLVDDTEGRIVDPGTVAVSGDGLELGFSYDDFVRQPLGC